MKRQDWLIIFGGLAVIYGLLAYENDDPNPLDWTLDTGSTDATGSDGTDSGDMKASAQILDFIKSSEGLVLSAVPDAGEYEVGYGHDTTDPNATVTPDQAETLFDMDIANAEAVVNNYVTVPLTQGQFDALVSFVYNAGPGALLGSNSTVLTKLNSGDYSDAIATMQEYVHGTINGVWQTISALVQRRSVEASFFNGGS